MKYKLTKNTKEVNGITLYQIQSLKDFGDVKKGDLGGWIEKEENLCQEDNCWVYGDALIYGNAKVYGNARVYGDALIYGNARVYGDAGVSDNARVYGDALISGNAWVYGNAWVSGNAGVSGNAWVSDNAWQTSPLYIQGTKHYLTNSRHGYITIGCKTETFDWWLSEEAEKLAKASGYTYGDIQEYKEYINLIKKVGF